MCGGGGSGGSKGAKGEALVYRITAVVPGNLGGRSTAGPACGLWGLSGGCSVPQGGKTVQVRFGAFCSLVLQNCGVGLQHWLVQMCLFYCPWSVVLAFLPKLCILIGFRFVLVETRFKERIRK